MVVTVMLFAAARDLTGRGRVDLELPTGATVADARQGLSRQYPVAATLFDRSALAVNRDFALDTDVIPSDAELAVIPPVSGG